MEFNDIQCPNCGELVYFCFDEWGHTPFHLHCNKCDINIGASSFEQTIELLKKYHKPHTLIEFYNK